MTKQRSVTNIPASIHDRLLQLSRRTGMQYQEALQYFAMERFLYRLSVSKYARMFVLKGALMLRVWQIPQSRLTRDIDLLGFTTNTTDHLSAIVRDICQTSVVDDGVVFPTESVTAEVIRQRTEYVGVRVQFVAYSGKSIVPMQIDVGFADAITPAPEMIEYPVMLDFPAPRIRAYPRETTIAEKFHAMADVAVIHV
jgi:predicted nucleotidyltransferase component of viral defense system